MNEKSDTIRRMDAMESALKNKPVVLHIESDSSDDEAHKPVVIEKSSDVEKQLGQMKSTIDNCLLKSEFQDAFVRIKHDVAEKLKQYVGIKDIHGLSKYLGLVKIFREKISF